MVKWVDKSKREQLEINGFIESYHRLPHGEHFSIVAKGERPDYRLRGQKTGELIGVELTTAYLSDNSVPEIHLKDTISFKLDEDQIPLYQERLARAVQKKIKLASQGYDRSLPLILSLYVNEYIAIYFGRAEWLELMTLHPDPFSRIAPFREIVMWNLANNHVLSIPIVGSASYH